MSNSDQSTHFPGAEELSAFIESHRRQLLAYVDRNIGPALRSRLEPEDIIQEVTVAALGSLEQFNVVGRDPFRLLCTLAEQRIIDAHRHYVAAQKRSANREVSIDAPAGNSDGFGFIDLLVASITSASQAFSKDQKEFRLQQAIAELSEEQREILRMRFAEGLATKEIADRVGKSDGAIRVMLTRTVALLQDILKIAG
ncbi:MAG: sigma-70 family RNA polymerase sigma factor [Planctomycetaceae bacterium]|nr:sigma-70 family RNA polymerase sigma factor [Planctomycetaceae bacterium]